MGSNIATAEVHQKQFTSLWPGKTSQVGSAPIHIIRRESGKENVDEPLRWVAMSTKTVLESGNKLPGAHVATDSFLKVGRL